NTAEKWGYFKQYYLKKLLATLVLIGFVSYFLYDVLSPKPETVLSVAMVNYPLAEETKAQFENDLNELLDVNPETQRILIDTSYDLNNYDYASAQKLSVYSISGELDLFIAPESQFVKYAFSNSLTPLTDALPTDVYSALSDRLFSCRTRLNDEEYPSEAQGPEGVYGIYAEDLPMFKAYKGYMQDPPVIGIIVTSKNSENAVTTIRHLYGLDK
ncbi:MAG TPA: hypothetical protein DHW61_07170, partial [Lachnoclostridium phytofermentans]|nr:hypothetical protein [Lachnoclostridium phytofermentans]